MNRDHLNQKYGPTNEVRMHLTSTICLSVGNASKKHLINTTSEEMVTSFITTLLPADYNEYLCYRRSDEMTSTAV
ncbi:hypothetical protein LSM04_005948 [Trypanosoma melophagium]|uniref:uncharacterized protein n=1 Tax=Trypanosoma melophagium TaxID=715481 RepID=UPI003519F6F3|nr:hypothetical protein LSM04_005948 [Trypanosoma melophagium]